MVPPEAYPGEEPKPVAFGGVWHSVAMTERESAGARGAGRAVMLIVGVCAGIALLLAASGVAVWAWVVGPALGQHATSDGSMCSWFSGECAALSAKKLASYTGISIPAGSEVLASHYQPGMKDDYAYGLICTADPDRVMRQARTKGYVADPPSTRATSQPSAPLGPVQAVLARTTQVSETEQIFVGGPCGAHKTRILLTYFWDG